MLGKMPGLAASKLPPTFSASLAASSNFQSRGRDSFAPKESEFREKVTEVGIPRACKWPLPRFLGLGNHWTQWLAQDVGDFNLMKEERPHCCFRVS